MKLTACIIETRPLPTLIKVINNHLKLLPEETGLVIFTTVDTSNYLKKLFPAALFYESGPIRTEIEYNYLLTSPTFWDKLSEFDRVLIFQHDSVLFKKGVEDFYPYDYVGSPWKWQEWGGNGGLSLRNPLVMKDICTKYPYQHHLGNEDVYFSNIMKSTGIGNLAPREICLKFGVEAVYSENTFGGHAYWKYLDVKQVERIEKQLNP